MAYVVPTGNPGLATPGTGDVLSGVIAAQLAKGLPATDAACLGAYLHGLAADLAAEEVVGTEAMVASDLFHYLPAAVERLKAGPQEESHEHDTEPAGRREPLVRDIMTAPVITVPPTHDGQGTRRALPRRRASAARPWWTRTALIGIVTEGDLMALDADITDAALLRALRQHHLPGARRSSRSSWRRPRRPPSSSS